VKAVLRKRAWAHSPEDLEQDVFKELVERADRGMPANSWAGLAVVIANRLATKARAKAERARIELRDLGDVRAGTRVKYDDLMVGDRVDSSKRIRGYVQNAIAEAVLAGGNCESVAERFGKEIKEVRCLCCELAEKIQCLENQAPIPTAGHLVVGSYARSK